MEKTLKDFNELLDKMTSIQYATSLIHFDGATTAPSGAAEVRGKMIGELSSQLFALSTSEDMNYYIQELSKYENQLTDIDKAKLRICKKDYEDNIKIPKEDQLEFVKLTVESEEKWQEAREKDDYSIYEPYLQRIIDFKRKFINYRGYVNHPYNTLLDDFEPNMDVEKLDEYFGMLKERITPLLKKITEKNIDYSMNNTSASLDKQREMSAYLMNKINYDLEHGLLKESAHPFTINMGQTDVRITTHYKEDDFVKNIYTILHEGGHALYEQQKMPQIKNTILDTGISMGIHESQSGFMEHIVGRDYNFIASIFTDIKNILGEEYKDLTVDEFYKHANNAKASFIRIEADELTYSIHIMIRYEIEKMIFDEDSKVTAKDLPSIWNQKVKEYLFLDVPSDKFGVLQDIHWSDGSFGYFPSYSLGNAYSAQFRHYMKQDLDMDKLLKSGDVTPIIGWLKENIHQYGSIYTPDVLLKNIRGEAFNPKYYVDYLEEKFTKLYEL